MLFSLLSSLVSLVSYLFSPLSSLPSPSSFSLLRVSPSQMFPEVVAPKPVQTFPVCAEGRAVLERANDELGLAFDDWDLDFYTKVRKRGA
jgi:hypothetical protein